MKCVSRILAGLLLGGVIVFFGMDRIVSAAPIKPDRQIDLYQKLLSLEFRTEYLLSLSLSTPDEVPAELLCFELGWLRQIHDQLQTIAWESRDLDQALEKRLLVISNRVRSTSSFCHRDLAAYENSGNVPTGDRKAFSKELEKIRSEADQLKALLNKKES